MLLPVVPLYAAALGADEARLGLVIGVFAFAAMCLRPVTGALADRLGRYPLLLAGSAIFAAAGAAYPTLGRSLEALAAVRLFHGAGMGLGPTAGTVMITDLAPPERRAEAMGLYGMAGNASLAVGPFLGAELLERTGFGATFAVSTALALASLLVGSRLPETRPDGPARGPAARPAPAPLPRRIAGLFHAGALVPSGLIFALFLPYGALVSFVPVFAREERLGNAGLFFTVFALAAVAVRGPSGRLADRLGRRAVTAPSLAAAALALVALARARSPAGLLGAAALFGVGFGAAQPAILAMAADRVPAAARGRALGTLYTAWELGISTGAVLSGLWAAWWGYRAMWLAGAASVAIGVAAAGRHAGRRRG